MEVRKSFQFFRVLTLTTLLSSLFITGGAKHRHLSPLYEKEVENLENYISTQMNGTWTEDSNGYNKTLLPDFSAFKRVFESFVEDIEVQAQCFACEVYIAFLIYKIKTGASRELLEKITYTICSTFRISTLEVCQGLVTRLGPTFYFIIKNRPKVTPKIFCGLTLQYIGCSTNNDPYLDFKVQIDKNKVESGPQYFEKLKILHFTDVHVDIDYVVNSKAECEEEILCCHGEVTNNVSLQAGEYGDPRSCDAPEQFMPIALDFSRELNADVMYMTGDIVPHNMWYTSREINTEAIRLFSEYLRSHYANRRIIFCIGNHEVHPVNLVLISSFSPEDPKIPEELRTNWIFDVTYEYMKDFVPADYKNNGNYVVSYNKFKVIVINTNVCFLFNMWQFYEPNDPLGVLKFLESNLKQAEIDKNYVHILGHVPPGHIDCNNVWSREFDKIVSRYKDVIKAQFYGHTHLDHFKLYSDSCNKKSFVNVAYIGPSVTSYNQFNPGVKVYETYGQVENFTSYVFDFKDNEWTELYNNHELGVRGDSQSMGNFVYRMAKDMLLFKKFFRYYNKGLPGQEIQCDNRCRKKILCSLVRSNYGKSNECHLIERELDGIALRFIKS